jgi:carboxyl-terminal processing protease
MTQHIRRTTAFAPGAVLVLALSLLGLPGAVGAQSPDASPGPVAADACVEPEASAPPRPDETLSMPQEFRVQLFDGVWGGIRDFYVDPDVKGLDWEAIGDEYAPLIIRTDNAYEVYELLREMVATLDDPYTYFLSPDDQGDPASFDPSYGGIGALLDSSTAGADSDGLRILYVFEGGSAKEAGIRERDRIVAVNGDPCARIADIRGPAGTDVTLTIVSPGEAPRDVVVERRQISPLVLPEARRLATAPSVGYLRLPSLAGQEVIDAVAAGLDGLIEADEPLKGLVIDVRATSQGAPGVIVQVLSHLLAGEVGAFHSRVGDEPITIEPSDLAPALADVPVVVLVDEGSEAEAEQLAAIMQDQGRATVVGQATAGETHGSNAVNFPDGSLLQIVSFGFKLPDGQTLEGQGVTPDIVVDEDWLAYPEAEDPGLLAAIEALGSEAPEAPEAPDSPEPTETVEPTETPEPTEPSPVPTGDAAG